MKYTDRKITPLKWHRFVAFLFLPLYILYFGFVVLSITNEMFRLDLDLPLMITPMLFGTGASISNLRSMFWPVMIWYALNIFFLIYLLWVWVGMFRWRESARKGWIIWLFLRLLVNGFILAGLLFTIFSSEYTRILLHDMTALLSIRITEVILIMILVWNVIYFILNLVYYHKRKPLFAAYYADPLNEGPDMVFQTSGPETARSASKDTDGSKGAEASSEGSDRAEHVTDSVTEPEAAAETKEPESSGPVEQEVTGSNGTEGSEEPETVETEDAGSTVETDAPVQPAEEKEPVDDVSEGPAADPVDQEASEEAAEEAGSYGSVPSEEETEKETSQEEAPIETTDADEILFCPNCGARITEADHLFCTHCGAKLR